MDIDLLSHTVLFRTMLKEEIESVLKEVMAIEKTFSKGETVFTAGIKTDSFGIVMSGKVQIENNDYWGNKSILDSLSAGQVFAETYALSTEPLMVDVVAVEESTVLFINMKKLLSSKYKSHIVMNLLKVSAKKNLNLSRRIFHTSAKNIRGRVLSYLSYQSLINNSREFDIPFNRQQLSDYLNVDRSALSAELSKMQKDGFLDFHKNHFILKAVD